MRRARGVAAVPPRNEALIEVLVGVCLFVISGLSGFAALCWHIVPEGHVGIYYRMGALLDDYTLPGIHFKLPYMTQVHVVQTTLQTDKVRNISCGTSGGVIIVFDNIEVVNRLHQNHVIDIIRNYTHEYDQIHIFQKIHHEINQFCSNHTLQEVYIDQFSSVDDHLKKALQDGCNQLAPGLEIISVRITKPVIPPRILENYEQMEIEKTKLLAAQQEQKVVLKKAETIKMRASLEAEQASEVAKIKSEQLIKEKEALKQIASIENDMLLAHERAMVDANSYKERAQAESESYRRIKEAESNKFLLTDAYIEYSKTQAIAHNTKVYFGNSIPQLWNFGAFKQIGTRSDGGDENE